ncbi:MAG: NUDIX domain-containing protein [Eubacteriales bacterium]|nr:NUDIX domain-containing protein [Eubacteriales bacterium]
MSLRVCFPQTVDDSDIAFVVISARLGEKWLYCRHSRRATWEIPGGHREAGESCEEAARRELYEETGALDFTLTPVCIYCVQRQDATSYGWLYFAQVHTLGPLPALEMAQVCAFAQPPLQQTYPQIQPALFAKTLQFLKEQF